MSEEAFMKMLEGFSREEILGEAVYQFREAASWREEAYIATGRDPVTGHFL